MKKQNKRSKQHLFQAVVNKWNSKKITARQRTTLTQTIVHSVGAAALMGSVTLGWAKDDATTLPEVLVTGAEEKATTYKVDKVSSTKYTENLRDIPQTIAVIPKEVIEEQGATTLREVLRNVPGISIQAGEGGVPAGDNLSIRGFNARTDIFVDNVRDFGGYARDPFNFEQIEVIKGPSSSYVGRGSTGGSINMSSKAPRLNDFATGSIGIGTDSYERVTADVNQPIKAIEGAAMRVNVLYHDNETPGRDEAENNRWGVAPSIAFGLGTPTRLTLSYFHLEQDNFPDYGVPWVPNNHNALSAYRDQAAPIDWSNFYGLRNRDFEKIATDMTTGKIEHDFNDSVSVTNQTRFGITDRDSIITPPRFSTNLNSTDIVRTDWKTRDQISTILANQTDFLIKFDTGDIKHTLVPGIEFVRETDVNYTRVATGTNSPATSLYSPNAYDPYLENIQRNGARTKAASNSVGIYAFDTMNLTEKLDWTGGVRWDYFSLEYVSIPTSGSTVDLERIDRSVSWRSGLVYKATDIANVYAAYGTSINPSAEGLALSTTITAVNNINSDPEETHTYEVGTKWELFDKQLALNAAVFRTEKINARTEDPANPTDIIALDGRQHVDGLELSLAGAITEKWQAFAAYTFMVSEITKANNGRLIGEQLGHTPKNTFSLWTTYELPANFDIGGGLQFVDTRLNNNGSSREAPSYLLADAMVAYHVNKNVTMRLNVYNIGDAEYLSALSGGHAIPGAARSAVLSTEFKF